ncbi:sensor domain-containing protein [Streptoalloteichus hindustanus]|uniref:Putative sensor n=1 Tax=Streptoalloteichus hindustanus TaxID=2017 RepID=A0A1M4USM6_STRHI|nr:sensor domain-containing protein [Streptoalloteichus hindustanus]SHE59685.1 Putative sensor [Streptoalloteichus hindustanus]
MWYWPLVRTDTYVWQRAGVRAFGGRVLFALLSLPLGLVWFPLVVVGLGVSAATSVVLVGVAGFLAVLAFARLMAKVERARVRVLLRVSLPDPPKPHGGLWRRLGDRRRWREALYLALVLPMGALSSAVVFLLGAMVVRGATYPFAMWGEDISSAWGGPTWTGAVIVHSGIGLAAAVLAPWLVRLVTDLHGRVARRLL